MYTAFSAQHLAEHVQHTTLCEHALHRKVVTAGPPAQESSCCRGQGCNGRGSRGQMGPACAEVRCTGAGQPASHGPWLYGNSRVTWAAVQVCLEELHVGEIRVCEGVGCDAWAGWEWSIWKTIGKQADQQGLK